ncbi:MAG: HNH endonuclease signature motif containing protein [Lachnospiraceae bacterium]|nr:HNH endonuclease signature motif containing protein [Lachnospiraceae bacterium]
MSVKRRQIGKETRRELWERECRKCAYCGMKIGLGEVTVDHKIPLSRGGPDCRENMVCSCVGCNKLKADRTVEEFRKVVGMLEQDLLNESPKFRAALRFRILRENKRKRILFHFEVREEKRRYD